MALFRKNKDKAADEAALQAEMKRLRGLSVDELAIVLLPGLEPQGDNPATSYRVQQLCSYLVRDVPGAGQQKPLKLMPRVNAALKRLHAAELVDPISIVRMPSWKITPLGEDALADGTVAERIAKVG